MSLCTRSTSSNIFVTIFCFWRSQKRKNHQEKPSAHPARQRRSERSERSPPRLSIRSGTSEASGAHPARIAPSSHQPRPSPLMIGSGENPPDTTQGSHQPQTKISSRHQGSAPSPRSRGRPRAEPMRPMEQRRRDSDAAGPMPAVPSRLYAPGLSA